MAQNLATWSIFVVLIIWNSQAVGAGIYSPPVVTIDLDAPPSSRWEPAVDAVLRMHSFEESFGAVFASHNATLFNNLTEVNFAELLESLHHHWPNQLEELTAISQAFQKRGRWVSTSYLAAWVWFHELAHSDAASDGAVSNGNQFEHPSDSVSQSLTAFILHIFREILHRHPTQVSR